jgi:hypothetical protein
MQHLELGFMQDNAPSYKDRLTREQLKHFGIVTILWPAFSPDLNPIETVWNWMKDWIKAQSGVNANLRYLELRALVKQAWEAVPQSLLDELIDSMPKRMQAVIDAKGGHTKY